MNSYWELDQRARIALSDDEVAHYSRIEAALKGILKPAAPVLQEVPDMISEKPAPRRGFRVKVKKSEYSYYNFDALFSTIEDAEAFIAMKPIYETTVYIEGSSHIVSNNFDQYELEMVSIYDETALKAYSKANEDAISIKSQNESMTQKYDSLLSKYHSCANDILKDRAALLAHRAKLENVIENLRSFVEIAEGNFQMGCKCILKSIDHQLLYDALSEIPHEWEWQVVDIFGGICLEQDNNPYRSISKNSL